MERTITGYQQDGSGDWVAELSCGHNQHVRHRPPFQTRPWVLTVAGRAGRLGMPIDCPLCDRAELPDATRPVRATAVWNQHSLPPGLRRSHRLAAGTWGRLNVDDGRLRFVAATTPPIDVVLGAGSIQVIPPEVEHEVEPVGDGRFWIEFLVVDRDHLQPDRPAPERGRPSDQGGDPACWVAQVCPTCGGIIGDPGHRSRCQDADGVW